MDSAEGRSLCVLSGGRNPPFDRIGAGIRQDCSCAAPHILADLADAEEHEVWHKREKTEPQSIHIWAPELQFISLENGAILTMPAAYKDDIWAIRPYVLGMPG